MCSFALTGILGRWHLTEKRHLISAIDQKSSDNDIKECIKWKGPDVNSNDGSSYLKKIEFFEILTLF